MDINEAMEILKGSPIGRTGEWCKAEGFIEGHDSREAEIVELKKRLKDLKKTLKFMESRDSLELEPYCDDYLWK